MRGIMEDPVIIRNTLLLAGLHYAWNKGRLESFEPTFLYHKVEAMQMVNQYLSDFRPEAMQMCIRQVASLCFAEVRFQIPPALNYCMSV
jgi:hypothetical protein